MIRKFMIITLCITLVLANAQTSRANESDRSPDSDSILTFGRIYSLGGSLTVERCIQPGSVPRRLVNVVFLTNLDAVYYERQDLPSSGGTLRRIQKLSLLPASGLDLEKLAGSLKPTDKVSVTGRYTVLYHILGGLSSLLETRDGAIPAEAPSTALEVTSIEINGQPVAKALAVAEPENATRLKGLATQRVLEEIHKRPVVFDGPEPRIGSVQVLDANRVQVDVEYLSGWGHVPMPELTERCLYVADNDSVTFLARSPANAAVSE